MAKRHIYWIIKNNLIVEDAKEIIQNNILTENF